MKITSLALAATLLAGTALAQSASRPATPGNAAPGATSNAPMPGVSPSTGVTPGTGVVDRNTGTAAAAGDRNQALATTGANAPQPARGANSFSEGEARRRIEGAGFSGVGALRKDDGGVWRGTATKNGASAQVWLDYKGNVGQDGGMAPSTASTANPPGTAAGRATVPAPGTNGTGTNPAARNLDGTTGNPPGTAATRTMDRALGTNATGTNPAANMPDGTPGNPPGTAAGRAVDRTLGTNATGANPAGNNAVTTPAR